MAIKIKVLLMSSVSGVELNHVWPGLKLSKAVPIRATMLFLKRVFPIKNVAIMEVKPKMMTTTRGIQNKFQQSFKSKPKKYMWKGNQGPLQRPKGFFDQLAAEMMRP